MAYWRGQNGHTNITVFNVILQGAKRQHQYTSFLCHTRGAKTATPKQHQEKSRREERRRDRRRGEERRSREEERMREKRKKRELERSKGERERERERERAKRRHAIIFISFWSSWVPLGCLLGASLAPLGCLLGPLGGLLGASWGLFRAARGLLGASWGLSGPLGSPRVVLGPTGLAEAPSCGSRTTPKRHPKWGPKRTKIEDKKEDEKRRSSTPTWDGPGAILGRSWAVLGATWGAKFNKFYGFSYYFLKDDVLEDKAYPRAIQEPKRAKMEPTWGPKGIQNGAQEDPKREQKRRRKMR